MSEEKFFYFFGDGSAEGSGQMKPTLGGKGAGLAEMTNLGIPVPPGFTISTQICSYVNEHNGEYPNLFEEQVHEYVKKIENILKLEFANKQKPLLVSVRSGATVSMPGMMDTILNLGLNDQTVEGLANLSNDERFAYDSYRRFIQMYSDVVLGVDRNRFELLIDHLKDEKNVTLDTELSALDWKKLVVDFKKVVLTSCGKPFPEDPWEQLKSAISAVFKSWNNKRAIDYRKIHNIPSNLGTAVTVQAMVFGNMGDDCATGVAFTRDPNTGEKKFFGEYLINAQGEDVVAGIRTPSSLHRTQSSQQEDGSSLEEKMPTAYADLVKAYQLLENHYKDMQDIEFTIQMGKLWMLQTRTGKRSAQASIRIAVEMAKEGLISWDTALMRAKPDEVEQLLHPTLDVTSAYTVVATGLPASPGAVSGFVVFDPQEATERGSKGEKIILVRQETSPEDVMGMKSSVGILTSTGGMTSHAAVVGRGMGKCCIVGCQNIYIDETEQIFKTAEHGTIKHNDIITLNGTTGEVILGELSTLRGRGDYPWLIELLSYADSISKMKVRANADNPEDSSVAREFGAKGIGLCRTEHMFFDSTRILAVRQMILALDEYERTKALDVLLPHQTSDFKAIFTAMNGYPVTIRLLDPPLHEFLPQNQKDMLPVARELGIDLESLKERIESMHEFNPMLGHRGCRLGITHPEIYDMQVKAILSAALELSRDTNIKVLPEIMIPLVGDALEFSFFKKRIVDIAQNLEKEFNHRVSFTVGTMIELPRAALIADEIAEHADFFSFGTNDLTQTTYGLSRDDISRFAFAYHEMEIWNVDPFKTLDEKGVGKLVRTGVELGRSTKKDLKIGICGEHGGDPASIYFCCKTGLDYVSCSPYRVPVARLAVAQATLKN